MVKKLFLILGILIVVGLVGTGVTVAAAVLGKAQKCSEPVEGQVRSEQVLENLIETTGVTIPDAEATALAQKYLAGKVSDARVCFTPGLGHISGSINLGAVNPSFYVSTGIDVSGATPKTVNLDIRIGSLPSLSFLSPAQKAIENLINENLSKARLTKKYSVAFGQGQAEIVRAK